jgi:hypothetical protein
MVEVGRYSVRSRLKLPNEAGSCFATVSDAYSCTGANSGRFDQYITNRSRLPE